MAQDYHSIVVSPLLKQLFPGFTLYTPGMLSNVVVQFSGESLDLLNNEHGDIIHVGSSGQALEVFLMLVDRFDQDGMIPTRKEIESYEVAKAVSRPSSTFVLRGRKV